jgi:uncharacterized RDD family membrane protein YckC
VRAPPGLSTPGLLRRFASALYDLLLLTALVLVATFPFIALVGDSSHGWRRHLLQAYVLIVAGGYFVGFWTRGGQTLAMKTWRIRLVRADGGGLTRARALHRYVLSLLSFFALGLGFAWALFDRDRQFLHDRLAGTAIVDASPIGAPLA